MGANREGTEGFDIEEFMARSDEILAENNGAETRRGLR